MNLDFWPTIAQISATFVGLVFVGLSLYLNSLHQAVEQLRTESSFTERSTLLIQVSAVSNLYFFLMPLLVSICILSSDNQLSIWWFLILSLLLSGVIVYLNEIYRESREQLRIILNERNSKILKFRLRYGKFVMYLFMVTSLVVVIALKLDWQIEILWEDVTRLVSGLSIIIGVSFGILDITLFDSSNIIFFIPPEKRENITYELTKFLQSEMYEVDRLYNQFTKIVESRPYKQKMEEARKNPDVRFIFSPEQIQEQEAENRKRIDIQYNWLKKQVPSQGIPNIVSKIQSLGCYVSAKEIQEANLAKKNLIGAFFDYKEMLGGHVHNLEEKLKVAEKE